MVSTDLQLRGEKSDLSKVKQVASLRVCDVFGIVLYFVDVFLRVQTRSVDKSSRPIMLSRPGLELISRSCKEVTTMYILILHVPHSLKKSSVKNKATDEAVYTFLYTLPKHSVIKQSH